MESTQDTSSRDHEMIAEAMKDWEHGFSSNAIENILALYAEDACLWGTLSPVQRTGSAAIRDYFEQAFVYQNRKVIFNSTCIRCYDDMAVSSGAYTFSFDRDGEKQVIPSRFSLVYARLDGKWLIVEHHSSAMPVD